MNTDAEAPAEHANVKYSSAGDGKPIYMLILLTRSGLGIKSAE